MKAVQSKETTNDDAQIRAIIEDYGEGLRNKDADRCVSHYADDLVQFDLAPPRRIAAKKRRERTWPSGSRPSMVQSELK